MLIKSSILCPIFGLFTDYLQVIYRLFTSGVNELLSPKSIRLEIGQYFCDLLLFRLIVTSNSILLHETDQYGSFEEFLFSKNNPKHLALAPHGGQVEPNTDTQVTLPLN